MELAILAVIVLVVILGIKAAVRGGGKRASFNRTIARPPQRLGIHPGHPAESIAQRLEACLEPDLAARVKDRVMKAHPRMKEREWEWRWFHLKRFLLMSAVMRQTSMYSERVDDVWHEMLMFTREYQTFCEKFCGGMIHHAPHTGGTAPGPGERAWFDWVYGELFMPTPACGGIWGAFYRNPLPQERIDRLERLSAEELRNELFNANSAARYADFAALIDHLIQRAKEQIAGARTHREQATRISSRDDGMWNAAGYGLLGGALIYASMSGPDDFDQHMQELGREKGKQADGGSSCSTAYCGGGIGDDGSGKGDWSSCASSCSSGGSSCSSSCSGGGCSS